MNNLGFNVGKSTLINIEIFEIEQVDVDVDVDEDAYNQFELAENVNCGLTSRRRLSSSCRRRTTFPPKMSSILRTFSTIRRTSFLFRRFVRVI